MNKCNLMLLLFLSGCMAHVGTEKPKTLRTLWLNKSYYGGIFYDDDRFRMLSEIPFEKLSHLKSPSGDTILPPPSDEIVPYGTRVVLQKVEFPTHENIFKRPLLTPRHFPWIYLSVALDRGSVTLMRNQTYIIVLPETIKTQSQAEEWLNKNFDRSDNSLSFLQKSPAERATILTPAK